MRLQKYWEKQITEYNSSGFSPIQYCKERNQKLNRLRYWLRKLKPKKETNFIEAKIIKTKEYRRPLTKNLEIRHGVLELRSGHTLTLESKALLDKLPELLYALQ